MSQRRPDYDALREQQARSQDADRVTARVERDLGFAGQRNGYDWVEEVEKI